MSEIKRLINKAYKIGDYYVAALLEEMYDELLCTPPKDYPPLPPRSELDARFNEMIAKGLILLFSYFYKIIFICYKIINCITDIKEKEPLRSWHSLGDLCLCTVLQVFLPIHNITL